MTERALNEALARDRALRLLFESSPSAVAIFSFEEARFLDVNQNYLELLDLTREELFARDAYELWVDTTHPEDLELERKELQRVVEGRDQWLPFEEAPPAGGDYRWRDFTSGSCATSAAGSRTRCFSRTTCTSARAGDARATRGAASASAEARIRRPPGRRRGPRLQQSLARDHGLRGALEARHRREIRCSRAMPTSCSRAHGAPPISRASCSPTAGARCSAPAPPI